MSKSAEREFVLLRKQENGTFGVADDTSPACWSQAPGKGYGNSSAWVQGPDETLQMLKLCAQSIWLGLGITAKIQAVILHCVNNMCVYRKKKNHSNIIQIQDCDTTFLISLWSLTDWVKQGVGNSISSCRMTNGWQIQREQNQAGPYIHS